tara:strand:- start:1256 stop:1381 length:126 start_codon:yes stop_codon:yes gene_type:complete
VGLFSLLFKYEQGKLKKKTKSPLLEQGAFPFIGMKGVVRNL